MLTCSACGGLTPPATSTTCLHCDARLRAPRWARRLTALLGPAGSILLAACYGAPGRYYTRPTPNDEPVRLDYDGDGAQGPWLCPEHQPACEAKLAHMPVPAQVDCDDRDPKRFPGADDPDGDGIDQNCDGVDGWAAPNTRATP